MAEPGLLPNDLDLLEDFAADEPGSGLLGPNGPFEDFPGAVLVAGHNGIVLAANEAAEPIAGLLRSEGPSVLRDSIVSALRGKAAQITPFLVPACAEDATPEKAFDLVALPWGNGAAALVLGRDISLERSLRAALIDSRQRLKDLVEVAADFAWETDSEGRFTFVSRDQLLDRPATDWIGRRASDVLSDLEESGAALFTVREAKGEGEVWMRHRDGSPFCLSIAAVPLYDDDGNWLGARGICRDVTRQRQHEEHLIREHNRDRLFAYVLQLIRNELDPLRMMRAATESLLPATAAAGTVFFRHNNEADHVIQAQSGMVLPDDLTTAVFEAADAGQDRIHIDAEGGRLLAQTTRHNEQPNGLLVVWRSPEDRPWGEDDGALLAQVAEQLGFVNQQLIREDELERLSSTDPLTGLLNRRAFTDVLERRLAWPEVHEKGGALFYIDVDNFKQVNDTRGHQTGDALLKKVARTLQDHIRSNDLAARLGGDEFAIFLGSIAREAAEKKGDLLLAKVRALQAFSAGDDHTVGLSIGIALLEPGATEDLGALVERADAAMYAAKRAGKCRLEVASAPATAAAP